MKNRFKLVTFCVVIVLVSFGCNRSSKRVENNEKKLVSIVSIGKIVDLDYDHVLIELKVDGSVQKFDGNDQLIKNVLSPNQTVTVGASVTKGGEVIAKSEEGNDKCPYVTRTLSPGVNHVSLVFCKIKKEDPLNPDKDKDKDKDKEITKPTEPDDTVKDPNEVSLDINPDVK